MIFAPFVDFVKEGFQPFKRVFPVLAERTLSKKETNCQSIITERSSASISLSKNLKNRVQTYYFLGSLRPYQGNSPTFAWSSNV